MSYYKSKSRSSKSNKGYQNDDANKPFSLGSLVKVRKFEDNEEYLDITEALQDGEYSYYFKVYGLKDKGLQLKDGDVITIKFRNNPKSPEFVIGSAYLTIND